MRKILWLCMFVLLAGGLYAQDQTSDLETLILLSDPEIPRFYDLALLKTVNMGIPGGDNYLVEWASKRSGSSNAIFVYTINDGIITKKFDITRSFDVSEDSDFDIMKDIPGTRIGTGSCVIHDYNGDGYDDVFNYVFAGNWFRIEIKGYDPVIEEMVKYCEIPFDIIDRRNGPAPIEFIKYKGMEGFQVRYSMVEVAGGIGWVPDPSPKNGKWFFYTWDEGQREFVEVEEVDPRYVGVETVPVKQTLPMPPPEVVVEEPPVEAAPVAAAEQEEETALTVTVNAKSDIFLSIYMVILVVVLLAVAGVVILLVARRKRKV